MLLSMLIISTFRARWTIWATSIRIIWWPTITTSWGAMGTTTSTTTAMGIMSTITKRITSISISTSSSWWMRRITLLTCWGHLTWMSTTRLRGILTIKITLNWYGLSLKEPLWEISLKHYTACYLWWMLLLGGNSSSKCTFCWYTWPKWLQFGPT